MEYKREQTTTILRRRNFIRAFRVLAIRGDNLIVRNSYDRNKTAVFEVSEPNEYKVGSYVDMVFIKTGTSSHTIELIGHHAAGVCAKGQCQNILRHIS